MRRAARWAAACALGLVASACAETHCAPPDAGAPEDAGRAPVDAGACPSREGTLYLGPVHVTTGCSGGPVSMNYWVHDDARRPLRWGTVECGLDGTDFVRIGPVPAGRYFVALETASGTALAGGELVRPAACADVAVTAPWLLPACSPVEAWVEPCRTTVAPIILHEGPPR